VCLAKLATVRLTAAAHRKAHRIQCKPWSVCLRCALRCIADTLPSAYLRQQHTVGNSYTESAGGRTDRCRTWRHATQPYRCCAHVVSTT
jgi:hypothetical protein